MAAGWPWRTNRTNRDRPVRLNTGDRLTSRDRDCPFGPAVNTDVAKHTVIREGTECTTEKGNTLLAINLFQQDR